MTERIPDNNEILSLRGRQQIEAALGALAFARVENDVTEILRSVIAAHDLLSKERRSNDASSRISLELGGGKAATMKAHVIMSLEVVLMSSEAGNEQKLVAQELYDILIAQENAA